MSSPAFAQAPAVTPTLRTVIKSQYLRLPFSRDIARVAVGDADILSADLLTNREVLVLGRDTGRTTLIVWFLDGTIQEFLFVVQRDLAVLQSALHRVYPAIEVESAPDRDALILTGTVPNLLISQTAEAVAHSYLEAGQGQIRRGAARPLLAAPGPPPGAPPAPTGPPDANAAPPGDLQTQPGAAPVSPAPATPPNADTSRLQGDVQPTGTVINLLQLENLPPLPEDKIREAIRTIGGERVTIRRVIKGNLRDDTRDALVLEGVVPNQIALVRILEVAARLFTGRSVTEEDIRVVADEAGGLTSRTLDFAQNGQSTLGAGGTASVIGGNRGSSRLTNQIRRNLGRATAIEAADGRIISFIEVADVPQIRVDIQVLEVNRTKLRNFDANSALLTSSFSQPSLNPAQGAVRVQDDTAARVGGASRSAIQNVLSFLSGVLTNELQFNTGHAAVDAALALLERVGIARTLSSPSLTVLSGETAQFRVGGELPVPTAFAPAFGAPATAGTTPGVFESVDFVPFGLDLEIRPLVGTGDTITLDVQPQIVTPDAVLTTAVRQTTGTNQLTTAFQTRALRTSSRLEDGQTLLVGGLTSNSATKNNASAPGLSEIPGLGWLFKSFDQNSQSMDLVVVVNPAILRTPVAGAGLWEFPSTDDLLQSIRAPALVNEQEGGTPRTHGR